MQRTHVEGTPAQFWRDLNSRLHERHAYRFIERQYEGKIARRSGVPYLNHINEGIFLLSRRFGFQPDLIDAYCLHPVFQSDRSLTKVLTTADHPALAHSGRVLVLAMEYRRVANAYISTMRVRKPESIDLSPIEDVNRMLVADKIQNRKDFMKYMNRDIGRESYRKVCQRYIAYFDSWLARLGVLPAEYERACADLELASPSGPPVTRQDSGPRLTDDTVGEI